MSQIQKRIIIWGFGAQGSAQAKNLSDSGFNVSVCLKPESTHTNKVKKAKIPLITDAKQAATNADVAVLLIPDGEQPKLWKEIESHLPKTATLIFAHGFNIHYKQIIPRTDLDVVLVAPLAHGDVVRSDFTNKKGVPCLIAVAQDATGQAKETAHAYAKSIAGKGPFIETTIAQEVESDLFAEQAVLCGGLFELIRAGFETLVDASFNPEIAYFCCLKEVRALANLVHEHGIMGTRDKISDTAVFGDMTRGKRVIDQKVKMEMKKILGEIRSGQFTKEIISDKQKGSPLLQRLIKEDKEHPIEEIHRKLSRTTK